MATSQKMRPIIATKPGFGMFPNPTTAHTSAMFVKKLVAVAVSNITYLRGLFPENAYADRELEGLHLKILTDKCSLPAASQIVQWIKGAFEAFDKKYLRQLIVSIYKDKDKPDVALETYTFSFTYEDEQMTIMSTQQHGGKQTSHVEAMGQANDIRRTTQQLLRSTFQLIHNMSPLEEDVLLTMKLLYYDEVTPEDYEPPGFHMAESPGFQFATKTMNLKTGKVVTPFHTIKLNTRAPSNTFLSDDTFGEECKSESEQIFQDDHLDSQRTVIATTLKDQDSLGVASVAAMDTLSQESRADKRNDSVSEEPMDCIPSSLPDAGQNCPMPWKRPSQASTHAHSMASMQQEPVQNVAIPIISPAHPASAASSVVGCPYEECPTPSDVHNARVRCACGWSDDGGLMIMCFVCQCWQHASCYQLLKESEVPRIFCCIECHEPGNPNRQCIDLSLISMDVDQRKDLCLYRHALSVCCDIWRISLQVMARELGAPEDIVIKIFNRLESDKVFKPSKGKGSFRAVNKEYLKCKIIPKYFGKPAILDGSSPIEQLHQENAEEPTIISISKGERTLPDRQSKRRHRKIEEMKVDSSEDEPVSKRQKASCVKGIKI